MMEVKLNISTCLIILNCMKDLLVETTKLRKIYFMTYDVEVRIETQLQ
jgi:hypothetical protein